MQDRSETRSPPLSPLLLATALLFGGGTACADAGRNAGQSTVDRILHQLDETARQRTADAQRIEDLTRRVAVLEALLQDGRDRAAAAAAPEPTATAPSPAPADSATATEPTPPLPVVRLAPPAPAQPPENLALAQGTTTRAAPDVVAEEEPPARDPADELSDIPYQGVGFGNDGGDGYLQITPPDTTTIRLVGTPRAATAMPAAAPAATAPGGTPSAAFGPVPRIPPMTDTATVAPPSAAAGLAPSAYEAGVEAYRARQWQEAIGWFERALAGGLDASKSSLALFLEAEATFQTRAYVEAVGLFERFLDRHPDHPRVAEALLRIGTASERLGDVERAGEMYRRVIAEHPASPAAAIAAVRLEAVGTEERQP